MPLMELTLVQQFRGQNIVNRFNYLATGTPATVSFSFGLASAIGAIESVGEYPDTGLMCLIAGIQSDQVTFEEVVIKDVYSVTDFYSIPFVVPLTGERTGSDSASPALAVGFKSSRTRSDIRRGQKRFTGLIEGTMTTGGALGASFVTDNVIPLAEKMGEVLSYNDEGNTLSYAPVIVGKQCYDPTTGDPCDGSETKRAYRYYPTFSEQSARLMDSIIWDAYPQVRTQVTRQYGRGS